MNRKVTGSLMVIGLVLAVGGGTALAYFSDVESSKNNTFSAGTLDLELKDKDEVWTSDNVETSFQVTGWKPGENYTSWIGLTNSGSILGESNVMHWSVTEEPNSLSTQIILDNVWYGQGDPSSSNIPNTNIVNKIRDNLDAGESLTIADLSFEGVDIEEMLRETGAGNPGLESGEESFLVIDFIFNQDANETYKDGFCSVDISFTLHQEKTNPGDG